MVYAQAHYAPGFGERYDEDDPLTTLAEAQARVRNYSYPVLRLGAGAYFATAYSDADAIVSRVLTQPDSLVRRDLRARPRLLALDPDGDLAHRRSRRPDMGAANHQRQPALRRP